MRAIRSVAAGRPFVDPSLSPMLVMTESSGEQPLTEREREVLRLLAEGLHTDEVAERMSLGSETVKADMKRALGKLNADTRAHAVAIALRRALIG
jgi:DNA-binding NarL/FixJ family response regulator